MKINAFRKRQLAKGSHTGNRALNSVSVKSLEHGALAPPVRPGLTPVTGSEASVGAPTSLSRSRREVQAQEREQGSPESRGGNGWPGVPIWQHLDPPSALWGCRSLSHETWRWHMAPR